MIKPAKPKNEKERLKALKHYQILDSIDESAYNDIVLLASQICNMPISLISFIDHERQWFKARKGIDVKETERDFAYCAHAILNPYEIMEVKNADLDERFKNNPYNVGYPYVKFYAGAPLVTQDGYALGTLCVIDHKENSLSEEQKNALKALARQVMSLLELRIKNAEIEKANQALLIKNEQLKKVAYRISHDIKSSLAAIHGISDFVFKYESGLSNEAQTSLLTIKSRSFELQKFVQKILEFYTIAEKMNEKTVIRLIDLANESLQLVNFPNNFNHKVSGENISIKSSEAALKMILVNLIQNAVKYNDKPKGEVNVVFTRHGDFVRCDVADNGMGIKQQDIPKIMQPFTTLNHTDRFGNKGNGVGLFSVVELLDRLGGRLEIQSQPGEGSCFSIYLPCV